MADAMIVVPVDRDTAQMYENATVEEREVFQTLLRLRLRELTHLPQRSLQEIMDDIGYQAEAKGLTPEMLTALLDER